MKKWICLLLALLLIAGSALAQEGETPQDVQMQRADMSSYLVILHTNDLEGDPQAGLGLSSVKWAKERFEQAGAAVLLLDAGNWLSGSEASWLDRGEGMTKLMREAGYSAAAVSAGEFAYGIDRLRELRLTAGDMRLLGDSIQTSGDSLDSAVVLMDVAGLTVGLFSLAAEDAPARNPRGATEGCTFEEPLSAALSSVQALEDQACDLIIGLCSAGDETARRVASEVEGIDLLLCAGGSAFVGGEWSASGTLLAQAGSALSSIGCVVIDSQGNATALSLDETYFEERAEDTAFEERLIEVLAAQQARRAESLATLAASLSGENSGAAQTALGSWAADAVRARTGASVALLGGASIGASLPAGEVSRQTVLDAFSAKTAVVLASLSGAQLKTLLEQAVSAYPEPSERFLQLSGLSFSFDPAQPAGQRVHSVAVNGEPLDEGAAYEVALTDDLGLTGEFRYGTLSRLLADALAAGQAPFSDQPMEARIIEASMPTTEPEPGSTDTPANS